MGWNEGPSRNFFSRCFGEFQLTGKLDGLFQGPRGGNLQFQFQKKKDSTPAELGLPLRTAGVGCRGG